MSDAMTEGATAHVVELPAVLDTIAAADLKLDLELALADGHGVQIEAGGVQRVTTPGLQVLVAAARSFAAGGQAFHFGACAEPLTRAVCLLGVAPLLGLEGE